MAIDLGDYVEAVRAASSPPGSDLYPDADDDAWILVLSNAFWDGYLHKLFQAYTEADGTITNTTAGGDDIARDQLQLVILYASMNALFNLLAEMKTRFKGRAGPTEFEYERSATVLVGLLRDRRAELAEVTKLTKAQGLTSTYYLDAVSRRLGMYEGDVGWVA